MTAADDEATKLEADATVAEKSARAQGITKMKEAMSGAGGEKIVLFPTSDSAIGLQQMDVASSGRWA